MINEPVARFVETIAFQHFLDRSAGFAFAFENRGHYRFLSTGANYFTRSLFPQQKRQGIDQYAICLRRFLRSAGSSPEANSTAALSITA